MRLWTPKSMTIFLKASVVDDTYKQRRRPQILLVKNIARDTTLKCDWQ